MGNPADVSGSSDSSHEEVDALLQIRPKSKFFNSRKQLEKFLKKSLSKIESFDQIACSNNSYDLTSCGYIAELINEKGTDGLWFADFSNMFVTRKESQLFPSLKLLIDAVSTKSLQELYLDHNALNPTGVAQFSEFLKTSQHLHTLSLVNTGLGAVATEAVADALIANESIKLRKLCISRSNVMDEGAQALSRYF